MALKFLSPKETKEKKEIVQQKVAQETLQANNLGEYVKVNLSTGGRFDFPDIVYFKPYTMDDITSLNAARPEDLIETLIYVLNKNKLPSITTDCEKLKLEEVLDITAKLYGEAYDPVVEYPIECESKECESNKPFFTKLNINNLNILSIENIEDNIKDAWRELFEKDSQAFADYVSVKYDNQSDITIDQAINDLLIKEPFSIVMHDNKVLNIKFVTVGDLAFATKRAYSKYSFQLRKVNDKKYKQLSDEDAKIQKQIDFENIQIEMFKELSAGANAASLVSIDGVPFNSFEEKISFYKAMPPKYAERFKANSERLKFGINHEIEAVCPACGEKKISPLEHGNLLYDFIPSANSRFNKTDMDVSAKGKQKQLNRIDIFF